MCTFFFGRHDMLGKLAETQCNGISFGCSGFPPLPTLVGGVGGGGPGKVVPPGRRSKLHGKVLNTKSVWFTIIQCVLVNGHT